MSAAPWLGEPNFVLLTLLFAGHVLGDFLFQSRAMVERKREPRVLLAHAAVVLLAHGVAALPFLRWGSRELLGALLLIVSLAALHALVDLGKARLKERAGSDSLGLFITDQAVHAAAIVGIWGLWRSWLGAGPEVVPGAMAPDDLAPLTAVAIVVSAYVLNGNGAAALIKLFLDRFPVVGQAEAESPEADIQSMGRTIGILERMLLLSLIMLGQWQAVGWVFAGKTVARFRELDKRAFSEYYLIGTLSSLLFAAATGSAVRLTLTGGL